MEGNGTKGTKSGQQASVNLLGIRMKDGGKTTILPQHDGNILVKVAGAGERVLHVDRVSLLNKKRFQFIGAKEDLSDTMAVEVANVPDGKTLAQVKFERVCARIEFLELGTDEWRPKSVVVRESPAERRARELAERRGDVVLAIMRVKGYDSAEELEKRLSEIAQKQGISRDAAVDAIGATEAIRAEVLRIQAARQVESANIELANSMLDEF